MPNAWLNHVRQFRKNNRHLSYKQLLSQAKNSYGGGPSDPMQQNQRQQGGEDPPAAPTSSLQSAMQSLRSMTRGGGVTGFESRSSLTRSASTVGGRRRSSRSSRSSQSSQSSRTSRSSRKTRRSRR